jgi:hypothetical protein
MELRRKAMDLHVEASILLEVQLVYGQADK